MSGIFTQYQPKYAARGIATFPVKPDKAPASKGWLKLGLRGSTELADKFTDTDAFGYVTGKRSKVTVLDIDTTDEKVAEDAMLRHGPPGLVVRTASGKRHLVYGYGGEGRHIRPWKALGLDIDVLGDNGFVLAAPSKLAKGSYEIIHGHLDDLDRLKPMVDLDGLRRRKDSNPSPQHFPASRKTTVATAPCSSQSGRLPAKFTRGAATTAKCSMLPGRSTRSVQNRWRTRK